MNEDMKEWIWVIVLCLIFVGVTLLLLVTATAQEFQIAVLPDMQTYTYHYNLNWTYNLTQQYNLSAIIQVGDIIESNQSEVDYANEIINSWNTPFAMCIGNHEVEHVNYTLFQDKELLLLDLNGTKLGIVGDDYENFTRLKEIIESNPDYQFIVLIHDAIGITAGQVISYNFPNVFMLLGGHYVGEMLDMQGNIFWMTFGHEQAFIDGTNNKYMILTFNTDNNSINGQIYKNNQNLSPYFDLVWNNKNITGEVCENITIENITQEICNESIREINRNISFKSEGLGDIFHIPPPPYTLSEGNAQSSGGGGSSRNLADDDILPPKVIEKIIKYPMESFHDVLYYKEK